MIASRRRGCVVKLTPERNRRRERRERRERSGSSSPAFTGIVHAEGSIHSWAYQLRTNDDAPIRDGELPPWFRSLASAQVSCIRCFFGAYYRYREPVKYRMDLTGARWGLSGAEAILRQGSGA